MLRIQEQVGALELRFVQWNDTLVTLQCVTMCRKRQTRRRNALFRHYPCAPSRSHDPWVLGDLNFAGFVSFPALKNVSLQSFHIQRKRV